MTARSYFICLLVAFIVTAIAPAVIGLGVYFATSASKSAAYAGVIFMYVMVAAPFLALLFGLAAGVIALPRCSRTRLSPFWGAAVFVMALVLGNTAGMVVTALNFGHLISSSGVLILAPPLLLLLFVGLGEPPADRMQAIAQGTALLGLVWLSPSLLLGALDGIRVLAVVRELVGDWPTHLGRVISVVLYHKWLGYDLLPRLLIIVPLLYLLFAQRRRSLAVA